MRKIRAYLWLPIHFSEDSEGREGKEGLKTRIMEEQSVVNTSLTPTILAIFVLTRVLLKIFDDGAVVISSAIRQRNLVNYD